MTQHHDPQVKSDAIASIIGADEKPLYQIRNWDQHFEISQSRKATKLNWVAIPNKHDGKGFRKLMRLEDGISHYGVWVLLVQVASKCPERGVLVDEDGPLTTEDLELKTGCPAEHFDAAFGPLCEIRWLEQAISSHGDCASSTLPGHYHSAATPLHRGVPTEQNRTGQDITQQHKTDSAAEDSHCDSKETIFQSLKDKGVREPKLFQLAARAGLTVGVINRAWHKAQRTPPPKNGRDANKAALLASLIDSGDDGRPDTAAGFYQQVKAGLITHINGVAVSAERLQFGEHDGHLYLKRDAGKQDLFVSAKDLSSVEIQP